MKVSSGVGEVKRIYIEDADGLDPITVMIEDMMPGVGQITIICWGESWTSFWGAMSGDSVADFILRCDRSYIAERLWYGQRPSKVKKAYLLRIIDAVKSGLIANREEKSDGHN